MANRFWVGGTGTWDNADTTHWASASNGAGGQTVPGSGDTVTFDGSSGGGTVTVNHASNTIQSLTMGAFTGTLDFATNDNNITLTTSTGFSGTGTGARVLNMGDGTWTLSSTGSTWDVTTATNFTLNRNGSTIAFTGTASTSSRVFIGNTACTYNIVSFAANTSGGLNSLTAGTTITTLQMTAPATLSLTGGITLTLTNAPTLAGTASNKSGIRSSSATSNAVISCASGTMTIDHGVLVGGLTFSGGATFTTTNTYGLLPLTGITPTATVGGGGGGLVIA